VTVEDGFTLAVKHTSRDNVSLDSFLLKIEHHVFDVLDLLHLLAGDTLGVVCLSEWMMEELLAALGRC